MSILSQSDNWRDIAATLGHYFESRSIPFHIEERANGTLHIGFDSAGHPATVTVSFDESAYRDLESFDDEAKRRALSRIESEFARLMNRGGPSALAGEFRIHRV
ncbi:hypothetical protein [Trinickia mobilis]|uniref:hypothetical protein n=1 Tax=Trinickia mobilis TaxID=2816356 RepID=UPI001A901D42|nr:hypothetical protein [Trinickia mobilis]